MGQNLPYLLRRQDHPPAPHPSSFPWQLARPPPAVSLSLSLFLSNDSARRAHTVMCFRTQSFVHGGASQNKDCCVASRGAKSVSIFFSRPAFPSLRKNVWKQKKRLFFSPGYHSGHLRTETLVTASAVFKPLWAQHGLLEDLDTCERLTGFQTILGATWAS